MSAAIQLRDDFDAKTLRELAKGSRDPDQLRRLLALAEVYDEGSRSDAAKMAGVGLQTLRDWVVRFNGGGPEGLIDPKPAGKTPRLNDAQRQALVGMIESGPIPALHGVVRWRLVDLAQWISDEFRIRVSIQTLSRELRALGYRKLSARPRHYAQDPEAMATAETDFDIKKNGSSVGTMRFAASATTATFIMASEVSLAADDQLEIIAPATPDATLADLAWTLRGSV